MGGVATLDGGRGVLGFEAGRAALSPYLKPGVELRDDGGLPAVDVPARRAGGASGGSGGGDSGGRGGGSEGFEANRHYFGQRKWMEGWLEAVHRYPEFRERWEALVGSWDGLTVVEIGCGPGNVFASVGGSPAVLIGVDIGRASLEMAAEQGYVPLLADAHDLPLRSGFADLVIFNATLHHCDEMDTVLREAARLVRPADGDRRGGRLVADHEPQRTAYDFKGLGKWMWRAREPLYRLMGRGGHRAEDDEQRWALATEIHHGEGDGVSPELYRGVLEPMGFEVKLYPHNHTIGAAVRDGARGRAPGRMRLAARLSGIDPDSPEGAMTLMCVAERRGAGV